VLYDIATRWLPDPVGITIVILIAALVAEHNGKRTLGRGLVAAAALFLVALAALPIDEMLARPIENVYPHRPALPAHVDGIVVLGGGSKAYIFAGRGIMGENAGVMRMVAGAELARRFPKARFVYTGTSGGTAAEQATEFAAIEQYFRVLGVAPGRTIYERHARDTYENIAFTRTLERPRPGETWLLVTSALHLPRAMAIAGKLGWPMVPWPSDYVSPVDWRGRSGRPPSDGLLTFDRAIHEWFGRVAYAIAGRS
jgi:uncharacterized SAM-binding protein YcdF (DUF218 family)